MFDITKLALKIPNFLTHEECDKLIEEFEQKKEKSNLEASLDYKTNTHKLSSFQALTLDPYTSSFDFIKSKTKIVVSNYLSYLDHPKFFFTELLKRQLNFSHKYRIMKYDTGASIHPHSDHDIGTYGSISFNLNDNYEGGEFKFFNGNYTVSLGKGDALIFPADSFWVHEVTPVTKGTRYSVNSFLTQFPLPIIDQANHLYKLLAIDYVNKVPEGELLGPYN